MARTERTEATDAEPWPWAKMQQHIENGVNLYQPLAVVVATGTFSPVHTGHIQMLHQARWRLQQRGFEVLGGWLSIANDAAVVAKHPACPLSASFRLQVAELAVCNDSFVSAASWEVGQEGREVSYAEVVAELREAASQKVTSLLQSRESVKVFLVTGSDEVGMREANPSKDQGLVIVPRVQDSLILESPYSLYFVADKNPGEAFTFSSATLRTALATDDRSLVRRVLPPPAADFLLQPSEDKRLEFWDDFEFLSPEQSCDDGRWPCGKVAKQLAEAPEENKIALLITNGAFNLTHHAHLLMMEQARSRLERAGYFVAGGFISVWGDGTAQRQAALGSLPHLSAAFRYRVAELSVCDHDWLAVERLDEKGQDDPVALVEDLQKHVQDRFPLTLGHRMVDVFYVCGSDVAEVFDKQLKGLSAKQDQGLVAVERNPADLRLENPRILDFATGCLMGQEANYSSTALRQLILAGDYAQAARQMAPAAARFVLGATVAERAASRADYQLLGILEPGDKEMGDAQKKLKETMRAWTGPAGMMSVVDLIKLLRCLDPSWKDSQLQDLMAMANKDSQRVLVTDNFIDNIFSLSRPWGSVSGVPSGVLGPQGPDP